MKRFLIVAVFFGFMFSLSDVHGSAKRSQEELNNELLMDLRATNSKFESIKALLEAGASANSVDAFGLTALMLGVLSDRYDVVELLLKSRADVNAVDNDGHTALMLAVWSGRYKVFGQLLQAGANVNAVDGYGQTALILAAVFNRYKAFEQLLQAGATVNVVDSHGQGVMHMDTGEEIKQLLIPYKALTITPIDKLVSQEPKPEDYISDVEIPAGAEGQEVLDPLDQKGEQLEQGIKAFEQDRVAYWRNKVQEAYKLFLNGDSAPLRTLFTQKIYTRIELLSEIVQFFNSRAHFMSLLKQLEINATAQEKERLQSMINIEERRKLEREERLQQEALALGID